MNFLTIRGMTGDGERLTKQPNFTPFTPLSAVSGQALRPQWSAVVRMLRHGRICSLFSNEFHLPKLDVTGSIPASRSIESIGYK